MQPPAVDDADAAIVVVTIVDEPPQARDGFRGGLTMQVEPAAWGVLSTLQFSDLTPVHTWGNEARLRNVMIVFAVRRQAGRRGRARSGDLRSSANAPARVRREPDDVRIARAKCSTSASATLVSFLLSSRSLFLGRPFTLPLYWPQNQA